MIIIRKTPKGNFQVRVKASNGKILLTSEPYKSKRAAINCIKAVAATDNFDSPTDGFSKRPDIEVLDTTGKLKKTLLLRNI
jgi:uncharacterized protein YegP (UPF0339 family)